MKHRYIIDLYTIPSFCAQERDGVYDVFGHLGTNNKITIPSSYDNYTPKNKKLFMFPFSYLSLTTHMGDVAIYRWEYFEGTTGASCQFEVDGTLLGGGEIRCYPRAYNGQDHNVQRCIAPLDSHCPHQRRGGDCPPLRLRRLQKPNELKRIQNSKFKIESYEDCYSDKRW